MDKIEKMFKATLDKARGVDCQLAEYVEALENVVNDLQEEIDAARETL